MKARDTNIPRSVLSQAFADRMGNRQLVAALFTTYKFDPGFFQQHILADFFDIQLNAATAIRWQQLEDRIRDSNLHIAVYYDQNGLESVDDGGVKLDIQRLPIRMTNGAIFHTKNVFVLVEPETPDDEGNRSRALLVACLSANLTKAGWWENVEVCHIEEIHQGEKTWLKDDLLGFLRDIQRRSRNDVEQRALKDIVAFLDGTESRERRSGELLPTRFYYGPESVCDFLERVAGDRIRGMHLEIISPYFDGKGSSPPLQELLTRFEPRRVQVYLPRGRQNEATCNEKLYHHIESLPDVAWARLPDDLLRSGNATDAAPRFVHAKVYRFFQAQPKREILFVGSANLTTAAHAKGGNLESGFLVEVEPSKRPEPWMTPESTPPTRFVSTNENENSSASIGTKLRLRYHWDKCVAEVYWDDKSYSPELEVKAQGELVFAVYPLVPMEWMVLPEDVAKRMATILRGASLFLVYGEGDSPGVLLVQEEGMHCRPSILQDLSIADILRSWALLTPEQRAAFIEARGQDLLDSSEDAHLVVKTRIVYEQTSIFDQFAGFFHAFGCLNRKIREVLGDAQTADKRKATTLLFGAKYDSLTPLLERLTKSADGHDAVDRYVIALCARQLCNEIAKDYPDFWAGYEQETKKLEELLAKASTVRQEIVERNPQEMEQFLDWFDKWFLRRVKPREEEAE